MKTYMKGRANCVVRAPRQEVFEASSYENISLWSKMFTEGKVISKKGNTVVFGCKTKIMFFRFHTTVTGVVTPHTKLDEIIDVGDGSITKETMIYSDIPEGTRIDWSGGVIKIGKSLRIFGPILHYAFPMAVSHDLRNFAKFVESGEYKKHKSELFS